MTRDQSRRTFLKTTSLAAAAVALRGASSVAQSTQVDAHIELLPAEPIGTISPEIYSHFIEHLGGVIYDGVWVGPNSKIPNTNGIRTAFLDAMRAIKAPLLRWPGGCFADSYDWRDGLGPREKRPARTAFWGQQDTNQYGLHEFMHTCKAIGCKPYLAANLRTMPAREFYQEIEYCNAPAGLVPSNSAAPAVPNAFAALRAANGDPEPFNVDIWGVGNESWGCGGNLTPEEYAAEFRRYTAWTPSYSKTPLRMVAVGPNGDDVDWTTRLFKALHANPENARVWGLSIHYYTSGSPTEFAAGDALKFNNDDYYDLLTRGSIMEKVVTDHWKAMAAGTPSKNQPAVKLVVDEWGAWYGKGTELAPQYNLSQQSTMRDALLTGITLDIFQRHADKVAVANVAQTINCIHSLMLAQEDKFTLTPTFHVFQMYLPHRGRPARRSSARIPRQSAHARRWQQLHRLSRSQGDPGRPQRLRLHCHDQQRKTPHPHRHQPTLRPPPHHRDHPPQRIHRLRHRHRPSASRHHHRTRQRPPHPHLPTRQRDHTPTHPRISRNDPLPSNLRKSV